MSDSFGSILQLPAKANILSNVNLLFVTDSIKTVDAITNKLHTANVEFTYDAIAWNHLDKNLSQQKYSAVIYDHSSFAGGDIDRFLTEKIKWWSHFYSHIPLILVVDNLNESQGTDLIQLGLDEYVLRHNLDQFPKILQNILFNCVEEQTIIVQQNKKIKQLEIEKESWLEKEQIKKEHIVNLETRIKQLETEKRSWLGEEKTKQEHISHLNHELRSPISSILGFARMLKEEYYGPLNKKQLQYATGILSSGEHLLALVKNYLDIVKIDANKQTLDLEKLAVGEICQAAMFIVAEKAKSKGLELTLDLGKDIDFCTGDSLRLKQVLINLLTNAIKFTDQGSITLKVTLKGDLLYFAVIDTGTGISANNINKLFKPFPQITSHHESTGLGLALSRKLAQLHGGDITVTSELDKGSCFTLSIPQYQ